MHIFNKNYGFTEGCMMYLLIIENLQNRSSFRLKELIQHNQKHITLAWKSIKCASIVAFK